MASLLGNSIRSAVRSSRRSVPILKGSTRFPIRRGASSQSNGGEGSSFNKGIIAVGVGIAGVTLYTVSSLSCLCNSLRASSGALVQVAIRTCKYLTFYLLKILHKFTFIIDNYCFHTVHTLDVQGQSQSTAYSWYGDCQSLWLRKEWSISSGRWDKILRRAGGAGSDIDHNWVKFLWLDLQLLSLHKIQYVVHFPRRNIYIDWHYCSFIAEAERLIAPEVTPDKEMTSSSSETMSSSGKPSEETATTPAPPTLPGK